MRGCKYFIILCCLAFQPFASKAQDITGLWKGVMHNDTTGRDLRYEIAISEYKGKLSGYSHTFFIVDDKEYYGIKKVKIKKQDDKILIEDQELIANNYPIPPNKGVRQLNVLTLEIQDSTMVLSGPFATNRTKEYHPLTGSIRIQRKSNFRQSALVPHLEELGLAKNLSFIEPEVVAVVEKPKIKSIPAVIITPVKKEKEINPQPVITKTEPVVKKTEPVITKTDPVVKKPDPVIIKGPAADVNNRKIETIQSVFYKSDSLVLTLYDNGEVDGDTVSVLMNGKVIMPMVGLSTKAVRKTISITKETPDSIQLIMYAENLGSIPPNTGLLVVHDGEDIYEIRFSGDYQKNAAIVFRRKK